MDNDTADLPGIIEQLSSANKLEEIAISQAPMLEAFNPKKFGSGSKPGNPPQSRAPESLLTKFIVAKKVKKEKENVIKGKVALKYFFIFDDVSKELKSTAIK